VGAGKIDLMRAQSLRDLRVFGRFVLQKARGVARGGNNMHALCGKGQSACGTESAAAAEHQSALAGNAEIHQPSSISRRVWRSISASISASASGGTRAAGWRWTALAITPRCANTYLRTAGPTPGCCSCRSSQPIWGISRRLQTKSWCSDFERLST